MKVAFIHYHLKPGGVTTVLRHQLEVLSEGGEGLVLSGIPPADPSTTPVSPTPRTATMPWSTPATIAFCGAPG
jgi:hypothetical protein